MLIPPTRCFKGLIGRDVVCRLKNPTRNIKRHNNLPPGCFFLFSSCSVRLLKSHRWGYPKEASVRYQFPTVNSVITTADVVCITLTINNKKKKLRCFCAPSRNFYDLRHSEYFKKWGIRGAFGVLKKLLGYRKQLEKDVFECKNSCLIGTYRKHCSRASEHR